MRHKHRLDLTNKTDREIWAEMPMGDIWVDSEVHKVWFYLLQNQSLEIPDSWMSVVLDFNRELSDLEPWWGYEFLKQFRLLNCVLPDPGFQSCYQAPSSPF